MSADYPSKTESSKTSKPRRPLAAALKVLAVLCVLALVPLANYEIDPSALFVTGRADTPETAAAALLLEGSDVTGLKPNYNERLLRREYVTGMTRPARVIVAGSSRGEFISHEMLGLGEGEMFNVSVAGSTLEDVYGFMGLLLERGLAPETFVLSLDPWMVSDTFFSDRYLGTISDGLYYMLGELGESPPESYKTLEPLYDPDAEDGGFFSLSADVQKTLFSITYFQSSLQYLFGGDYELYKEVRVSDSRDGVVGVLRADGSYSYSQEYRSADAEISEERARFSLPNVIGYEDYDMPDSRKDERLLAFLKYLTSRGIEVRLVMQPVSNTIYDFMAEPDNRELYADFFSSEELYRSLAAEAGARIAGGFNPYDFGYDMGDFYDGYHLKENRVAEIVASPELQPYVVS